MHPTTIGTISTFRACQRVFISLARSVYFWSFCNFLISNVIVVWHGDIDYRNFLGCFFQPRQCLVCCCRLKLRLKKAKRFRDLCCCLKNFRDIYSQCMLVLNLIGFSICILSSFWNHCDVALYNFFYLYQEAMMLPFSKSVSFCFNTYAWSWFRRKSGEIPILWEYG